MNKYSVGRGFRGLCFVPSAAMSVVALVVAVFALASTPAGVAAHTTAPKPPSGAATGTASPSGISEVHAATTAASGTAYRTGAPRNVRTLPVSAIPCPDGGYLYIPGLRIKSPNSPDVYLIDPDGYRRWIRTAAEYEQLFRDWNGIVINPNVRCILARDPLTDGHGNGAWLVRAQGDPAVYLIVDGTKRWIPSSAVFDKYHFAWNKVGVATRYQVDSTPTGAPWT